MKKNIFKLIICISIILVSSISILGFSDEESYADIKFKENVVFYAQHQDDETLWASSAIIEAINEVGADHVYIVQVSYGTGIKVFNNEKLFENMSNIDKYEYREREFLSAVNQLGIKRENIVLLPRINNTGSTSFDLMEQIALKFEKELKSVTHIAHTYKLDWHLQHLKNGSVIQSLYNAGMIKDVRYFVKPEYEKYIPKEEKIIYKTISLKDKEKIKKACEEYKLVNEDEKRDGIGYKSDHKSFDRLIINYSSILHTANI
ncbi:PIG-L family deacetylase [Romboutsia sp. 1001713B170207_170306_H8]|uniref:PIG-L family deacetylase n=1 Tax=Romboutsia sp. 1001713B170207_170306_H8 TaxID=2787112 RepID=UPI001898D8C5|nr:PIG-L family deacetylase [Romboutsia sp. 1001713B170207_170306_H8]